MKAFILIIFSLAVMYCNGQEKFFKEEEFIQVIHKYHPLALKAGLEIKVAESALLSTRGQFDPVLNLQRSGKEWDGVNYYRAENTELVIPTWYGIDIYAGKENITGNRINPEETRGALHYFGASIPLLQNLVIDKRRAALKQAKIFKEQSEIQKSIMLNDLLHQALKAYWDWWEHFHINQLMETALHTSEKRLSMIRHMYQQGARPAIDTLEAFTQVQYFEIRQNESNTALVKSRMILSTYLWRQGEEQYELPEDVAPQPWFAGNFSVPGSVLSKADENPEIVQYVYKLQSGEIEKQLKFQLLLPKLNLQYNQLASHFAKTLHPAWFQHNYQFGLSLSIPLLIRQGRGEYKEAKWKLEQLRLEQQNKRAEILNKVKIYNTEWQQTTKQLEVQHKLVANVKALHKGEETLFLNGESSLFLINAREFKAIESIEKLYAVQAKNRKAFISLRWALGNMDN